MLKLQPFKTNNKILKPFNDKFFYLSAVENLLVTSFINQQYDSYKSFPDHIRSAISNL